MVQEQAYIVMGRPPTGAAWDLPNDPNARKFADHTNIWGIGNLLWLLMRPDLINLNHMYSDDWPFMDTGERETKFVIQRYSAELVNLVFFCMRRDPRNPAVVGGGAGRITLPELNQRIERCMRDIQTRIDWNVHTRKSLAYIPDYWPVGGLVLRTDPPVEYES